MNVAAEEKDQNSILNYFRKMIRLRKNNPVLVYGAYKLLVADDPQVYAYTRTLGNEQLLILLNFSAKKADFSLGKKLNPASVLSDKQLFKY